MNEQQYRQGLAIVSALVAIDPEPASQEGKVLARWSAQVEAYEREHFPLPELTEAEVDAAEREWLHTRRADEIDGYTADDLGESPDR